VREGRIEPRNIDPKLFATARDVEIEWNSLKEQALSASDMKEFLDRQVPPFLQYHRLQKALMKHREIKERGGWEFIPEGKALKPGMEDERVRLIRKRLTLTGDLRSHSAESATYDNELVQAVKHFQSRHGLETDGVVGKKALSAMNIPVHTRIRQILVNMERYRWLKHQIGERALVVNIAGFMLAGINPKKGEIEITMPVIVGKQYHKTPVFSDTIKYIEFNPFWNGPPSIAKNEMLLKLKGNPYYLEERNIRVFSGWGADAKELDSTAMDWKSMSKRNMGRYRLRQDPGARTHWERLNLSSPIATMSIFMTPLHIAYSSKEKGHLAMAVFV